MMAQTAPMPQQPSFPQDTVPAEIVVTGEDDSIQVSAKLRPLRQIAGAPAAFYTYFWELGDGTFSFSKTPELHYKDTGTYQVRLYATNNYDDGKAPPTKPRPIKVKKPLKPAIWASHFFRSNGNIEMKINSNPKPGEDFVALIGYRNVTGEVPSGSLVLFYNERQFDRSCFNIADTRNYSGMDSSSMQALLAQVEGNPEILLARGPAAGGGYTPNAAAKALLLNMQQAYSGHTVMKFNAMDQTAEKFLFVTMHTLPEMIADTNAVVSMTAILVPDNPSLQPEAFTLEMPVVASHDPNRMQLKKRRINYRLMGKKKELTYKVQFQNTGKGPAKKVAIGIAVPKQLNTETVAINSMSPVCIACDSAYNTQSCIDTVRTKDSLYFVFKNIYLPGMQQDGVADPDSTKGFISYTIRFKKKPKKIPFSSSAAIIFDKNEPIYTNRATAKFIKGISPAIVAGYTFSPDKGDYTLKGPLQLGAVLAPFAPSRPYFQLEAYAGLLEKEVHENGFTRDKRDTTVDGRAYMVSGRSSATTVNRSSLQVVPLHFRYNITRWIGVGAGALAQVNISTKTTIENRAYLSDFQQPNVVLKTVSSTVTENTAWFASFNAAAFADLQIGSVKAGPAVGLRYIRQVTGNTPNRFFVYAIYRL
ncbi:PKD domain-containing protein [Chitinophaga jiangningensis]|uniref:PKD domain-containing protein n=2 Tax=Chitinophaga jiangningensis TaxID=1419482 RepID=A0A1M7KUY5_9BACT|nr:PKD domain-containing protein [Chitinophaga jiangningensis]